MEEKLGAYNRKRDFNRTLEPEGNYVEPEEHLRFVVQHHIARNDHYDLRLEWRGVLLSWAVPKGPSYHPVNKRLAIKVEDHPLEYRNFEGTIPKGQYGGGIVMLWDEGTWEPLTDVDEGIEKGSLKFVLNGRRLKGKWALVRMKTKNGDKGNNWLLIKERDKYVKDDSGIADFNVSIRTGRTMEEIEEGIGEKVIRNPFDATDVQLAKSVSGGALNGDEWLYELKYDGFRIIAYVEGNSARLVTRNNHDYTKRFPSIASSLIDLAGGRPLVLDGEMVVTDESGKTDFQGLQAYMRNPSKGNLAYITFDLLAIDGLDIRGLTLIERKEKLLALLKDVPKNLHYSRHVQGNGKESFNAACELGMEGIIGKKADSIYSGTRNGDWIKIKCEKRQEFVIGGFTLSDKKARGISSLLLGIYRDDKLIYMGRAGTGFSQLEIKELEVKFRVLQRNSSPFKDPPLQRPGETIIWLEPSQVAEIKFAELTKDNLLRQASYKGLRTDKKPKEIQFEYSRSDIPESLPHEEKETMMGNNNIIIKGIKITNPDKVIFEDPKFKKIDIIRYYEQVSERMLPYVGNRIITLVRCPRGISQPCFFQKHPGPANKDINRIPIIKSGGETEEYFYIDNQSDLILQAQMGTIEFHLWGSRVDDLEKPDIMVFDLDPDVEMDIERLRQGARDLRGILTELSLDSYLKTSGGKGYHVIVPLVAAVSWDTFYDFSRRVVEVMVGKWPDRYTANVRKEKRTNKIFIDWLRNGRGATSIAPYSIRARKGAPVAMPISWDELDNIAPNGIGMQEALLRIRTEDPWKDFFKNNQLLTDK